MTATAWRADPRVVAAVLWLAASTAQAAEPPAPVPVRLEAVIAGYAALAPQPQQGPIAVSILLDADGSQRVDFHFAQAAGRGYLLKPAAQSRAWWINEEAGYGLPVADASGDYWYDPQRPCAQLQARCSAAAGEFIAGRLARAIRYEDARHGPGGTRTGTLWIDSRTGLLLGYRGSLSDGRHPRSLRVREVHYGALDPHMFQPPATLRVPVDKGSNRR